MVAGKGYVIGWMPVLCADAERERGQVEKIVDDRRDFSSILNSQRSILETGTDHG